MSPDSSTARSIAEHRMPQDAAAQPGAATLTIERHEVGHSAWLTLSGEIDLASAPLLRQALAKCLMEGARTLHVDLTGASFCDCCGLSAFLHAQQRAAAVGGSVRLYHPTPQVARLLELTGTASFLLAPEPRPGGATTGPLPRRGRAEGLRRRWGLARRIGPWSR